MTWQDTLIAHAQSNGRAAYSSEAGVGIEFGDGSDAFWVLPGEPTSTLELARDDQPDAAAMVAEYERLNRLRERTLHVLEHHWSRELLVLTHHRNGDWMYEAAGGISGSLPVGIPLTRIALESETVPETIENWGNACWASVPSPEEIEEYLAVESEAVAVALSPAELEPNESLAGVLQWMGFCRLIASERKIGDTNELRQAIEQRGRIGRALSRLAERLPDARASFDVTTPGNISVEFSDGEDDFRIKTRSRTFRRRFRGRSPEQVGDELADEYFTLNGRRKQTLDAVYFAAARRGWKLDHGGWGAWEVFLGESRREVSMNIGHKLTVQLRKHSPAEALRRALAEHPDFAAECLDALEGGAEPLGPPPEASLRPPSPPAAPELLSLDAALLVELDRFAGDTIDRFLETEDALWRYHDRAFYDPEIDTWFDTGRWHRLAERQLGDKYPNPEAVLIMLDFDEPKAKEAARRVIGNLDETFCDISDSEVELLWRFRHEFPKVAGAYVQLTPEDSANDAIFARWGDPSARRRLALTPWEDDDELTAAIIRAQPAARQDRIRNSFVAWARNEHHCSPLHCDRLQLAHKMGWSDVAAALEENAFLLAGLLTIARRDDEFDEPGLLMSGELLLPWSALSPTEFLARLVATAVKTDLVALAKEASQIASQGKPDVDVDLRFALDAYENYAKTVEVILAVAWKRCRIWLTAAAD